MIRFAERWAGERFVGIPERRVAVVQYTITTRVDGDVLKVFWSYCSEVGFVNLLTSAPILGITAEND